MTPWDSKTPRLWLLTPKELEQIPDGAVLESIGGNTVTKGIDYIDDDVRFGHLAFGLRGIAEQPEEIRNILQTFILTQ